MYKTKRCPRCEIEKDASEFYPAPGTKSGLHAYCKPCGHAKTVEWRNKNPERRRKHCRDNAERLKERRLADPEFFREKDKERQMKHKYGITMAEYEEMLEAQDGCCAICGSEDPKSRDGYRFAIDHCHDTGEIRGLLCAPCNWGLGSFSDDPEVLQAAIEYLARANATNLELVA